MVLTLAGGCGMRQVGLSTRCCLTGLERPSPRLHPVVLGMAHGARAGIWGSDKDPGVWGWGA